VTSIRTPSGDWTLGELLGSGGYGRVHAARSLDGREAAIKLVPKEAGAERELLFADDLRGVPNVMPVVDTGETETDLVLVMPLAKGSLREYLGRLGRPLTQAEALPILIAIARALEALAGGERAVVHRDLKPENVLFDEDEWRLADFGIARYVAAATSQLTFRYSTTQYYRAPEQWRDEDATSKTDVYAFGLIGHELLTGSRPFDDTQLRHRHLHQDPPIITSVTPHLAAVIERCLAKDPRARPTASALRKSLAGLTSTTPPSVGLAVLQQANLTETSRMAQAIRHESVARSDSDRRAALLSAAAQQLRHISRALRSAIVAAAPAASPCSSVERPSAYAKAPSDYDGIATAGQTDASVAWALQLGKAVLQGCKPAGRRHSARSA